MLVDYPYEWRNYMVRGKIRTFCSDTPKEIVDKAKIINEHLSEHNVKPDFYFEDEETERN